MNETNETNDVKIELSGIPEESAKELETILEEALELTDDQVKIKKPKKPKEPKKEKAPKEPKQKKEKKEKIHDEKPIEETSILETDTANFTKCNAECGCTERCAGIESLGSDVENAESISVSTIRGDAAADEHGIDSEGAGSTGKTSESQDSAETPETKPEEETGTVGSPEQVSQEDSVVSPKKKPKPKKKTTSEQLFDIIRWRRLGRR